MSAFKVQVHLSKDKTDGRQQLDLKPLDDTQLISPKPHMNTQFKCHKCVQNNLTQKCKHNALCLSISMFYPLLKWIAFTHSPHAWV